jgi:hypothetical protein
MQSGTPFTIRWKANFQDWYSAYCSSCDVGKLDLWVTSFTSDKYNYKVAGKRNFARLKQDSKANAKIREY